MTDRIRPHPHARPRWRTIATALPALALLAQLSAQIQQPSCLLINHMGSTVDDPEAHHVLNRMTFGPTTALLALVKSTGGFSTFVDQQLFPDLTQEDGQVLQLLIELGVDGDWTQMAAAIPPAYRDLEDIQKARLTKVIYGRWQLNEVMTELWEDHFNTNFWQLAPWVSTKFAIPPSDNAKLQHALAWLEWTENKMLREHALGTFRDLLDEVVRSPAMLIYLNMVDNKSCTPNQNFAREFLELHTMGPIFALNGSTNYDQDDVIALSKAFTGWTLSGDAQTSFPVLSGAFLPAGDHCTEAKVLFGTTHVPALTIPSGTNAATELNLILNHVAGLEVTKDRICRKLLRHFLGDAAAEPGVEDVLLQSMKNAWGSVGYLQSVLCTLFGSERFQGPAYRWARVRSPLERVSWNTRIWDGAPTSIFGAPVVTSASLTIPLLDVADIGQPLFTFPPPIGFPQSGNERLTGTTLLEATVAAGDLYRGLVPSLQPPIPNPTLAWFYSPEPDYVQIIRDALPDPDEANPRKVAAAILARLYPLSTTAVDVDRVRIALGTNLIPADPTSYFVDLARGISVAMSFSNASLK